MILDDDGEFSAKSLHQLEAIPQKPNNFHGRLLWYPVFWSRSLWASTSAIHPSAQFRPRSILATYRLARNYHKLGNFEPMRALYHELLRQRPDRFHYVQHVSPAFRSWRGRWRHESDELAISSSERASDICFNWKSFKDQGDFWTDLLWQSAGIGQKTSFCTAVSQLLRQHGWFWRIMLVGKNLEK